ncbi:hypothetical protein PC116_g30491 [Phytophthora cactorum]|uniref:Uncharacterized protein n=1 Tax=Daldinia eschscholtzii TaxID=292717 RepID=A0AAX6MX88_9PEZI|nr:hypothetical protein PC116_g30491 [Phytophthora cactorum]
MNHRPELRRNGSFGSDTSSFYSVSSGSANSAYSVWSASESDSFVWREDSQGFYGITGAVTRYSDDRDDTRRKFAAHILSGPFAQYYKKKRQQHTSSRARSGRSSRSSPVVGANPGRAFHPDPRFQQRPVPVEPQYHHQEQQFPEDQFQQEQFHQEPYPPQHPPFHPAFHGGPPPPPPPPPAPAGFEGGFIQLGGPSGPPPPQEDPVWGNNAGYGPGVHVYD